ncbi:hypothetical protein [Croceicoccus sp. BE223]|uniref:hypothetical protein n=1 Tax=Croceicoccus sp. BE223 TaxID=2817716 RepID=UPI0028602A69|nr:hypothetical protein [Croceicoccus sp. BE223]MDR7102960.1 hypothetical protein [Croceicoccus sp. BE223]
MIRPERLHTDPNGHPWPEYIQHEIEANRYDRPLGADCIRWGWWLVAALISATMWGGIAHLLGRL